MSPQRYKTLLTYLPGMASVVNAFDSPQVQSAVYESLMEALDVKLETEGLGRGNGERSGLLQSSSSTSSSVELAHDLVQGESIHADSSRGRSASSATVF